MSKGRKIPENHNLSTNKNFVNFLKGRTRCGVSSLDNTVADWYDSGRVSERKCKFYKVHYCKQFTCTFDKLQPSWYVPTPLAVFNTPL